MKLNTWLDISSKYIEDFCVIFSVAVGYIFRKINWHILSGFFWCEKYITEEYFCPELDYHFLYIYFFIIICVICLLQASWVLCLKQKVVHCVLRFWLICVMLRSYTCWCFCNTFEIFWSQMWLCVITANTRTSLNQKQHELTLRFSSGALNLSSKV